MCSGTRKPELSNGALIQPVMSGKAKKSLSAPSTVPTRQSGPIQESNKVECGND
jgi:hypothetical protein